EPRDTSIASSKVRDPATFRCRHRPSTSWSSTSRPPSARPDHSANAPSERRRGDRMRRREFFIALMGGAVAVWPLRTHAHQPQQTSWLCFLTFDPGALVSIRFKSFFQGLRDLGYVDGQSITIEYLSADGQGERFPALVADCLQLKADIIVTT